MSIRLQEVCFSYGEKNILDHVNLEVREKEHIGIIGESGNGKSTLLKILAGLYEIEHGRCNVAGASKAEEIRKKVSVVMQSPGLLPLSIRDNVTCGHPISEEKIWNALQAAQLVEWVRGLPEGIDSQVGERAGKISGGQAQRIAIARAIAKDAPVVLLDEPTSALDQQTSIDLMEALEKLTMGKTVIHITHHAEMLKNYDRILLLKEGKLYAEES